MQPLREMCCGCWLGDVLGGGCSGLQDGRVVMVMCWMMTGARAGRVVVMCPDDLLDDDGWLLQGVTASWR